MKFRRKRIRQREYLESKMIIEKTSRYIDNRLDAHSKAKNKQNETNANSKVIYFKNSDSNTSKPVKAISNPEGKVLLLENTNEQNSRGKKRKQPISSNKKQSKSQNNLIYTQNGSRPRHLEENNTRDMSEYDNGANLIHQRPPESKSRTKHETGNGKRNKLLNQQQQEHLLTNQNQQQNVWLDRKSNNNPNTNNNNNLKTNFSDEEASKQKKKYTNHYENSSMAKKHQPNERSESNSKSSKATKNAINRIMANENTQQFVSLVNSDYGSGSSVSGSNRCIRNNSYLNANHNMFPINNGIVNLPVQNYLNGSNSYTNGKNANSNLEVRPSSSSSVASSLISNASNIQKNSNSSKKSSSKSNGVTTGKEGRMQHVQLNIIEENTSKKPSHPADYASYEITV